MAHTPTDFTDELRGVWHPTDCIVQVIDDGTDAEAAVRALRSHGIPASDVHRFAGTEFARLIDDIRRRIGPVKRLLAAANGSAEAKAQETYLAEAQAGHSLVVVRVGPTHPGANSRDDRLLAIADVMAAYRAHATVYYGGRGARRPLSPAAQTDFLGVRAPIR
jgi:hypothetical protein